MPSSDAEFAVVTDWLFGVSLTVKWAYGESYEINQSYNSYHGKGFHYDTRCNRGYDRSSGFLWWAFGKLYCGGIARASYGQFETLGWRDRKRISRWQKSSRRNDAGRTLRPAYVRLADHCRDRKNSGIRGVAVPIHGPGGWRHEGFAKHDIAA
jgi:hypothetical protein